ncbi:transcription antitermination factor NusB [uncultured Clostridium sp.]|jgi:N utilization substance protein B|uniref:transcription antitermination factor NusB n=1 Tax=uncultured Clostridium sp. TaxID=59620 RepID=UPI002635B9C9|nr:transcription antitermination factor NusB [uncultured Clostridium sp.]
MNRKKSREYLMQLVYQMAITKESAGETFDSFMENEEIDKKGIDLTYIKSCLIGIMREQETIDEKISENLVEWRIGRLSKVNLSIARIAVYEMLFYKEDDIPAKVAINEAIEICKQFSDEKSVAFINGLLDKIYKKSMN